MAQYFAYRPRRPTNRSPGKVSDASPTLSELDIPADSIYVFPNPSSIPASPGQPSTLSEWSAIESTFSSPSLSGLSSIDGSLVSGALSPSSPATPAFHGESDGRRGYVDATRLSGPSPRRTSTAGNTSGPQWSRLENSRVEDLVPIWDARLSALEMSGERPQSTTQPRLDIPLLSLFASLFSVEKSSLDLLNSSSSTSSLFPVPLDPNDEDRDAAPDDSAHHTAPHGVEKLLLSLEESNSFIHNRISIETMPSPLELGTRLQELHEVIVALIAKSGKVMWNVLGIKT